MSDRPDPDREAENTTRFELAQQTPVVTRPSSGKTRRNAVSLIWLVPILALAVTLAVAWNIYAGRGELIEVEFTDATGITPGETLVKFREISVGKVESVSFSPDLTNVVLRLRIDPDVSQYIDSKAEFWIVRPQVSAQGISRLDTVLTGVFVEGLWDSSMSGEPQDHFVGLDRPPLDRSGGTGTWIVLSSPDGEGLREGAPVMYNGLEVGRMENLRLAADGQAVIADAFIASPNDAQLSTSSVFWDTSGFSVSLGPQGVALDVTSVASLLQGGVQFANLTSGGQPIKGGHVFPVSPTKADAQDSIFGPDKTNDLSMNLYLDGSVRGLSKGAEVQYEGLPVGRVTNLAVHVTDYPDGRPRLVQQQVTIAVSPQRLGMSDKATPEETLEFLSARVDQGLRARVASSGLLGTSLMIEMVTLPDARPQTLNPTAKPLPIFPTVPGDLTDFTASAQGLMSKIGSLPLRETLQSVSNMMDSVTAIANSPDTRAIPGDLRKTLDDANATVADIREMVAELKQQQMAANLSDTFAQAKDLTAQLNAAAEKLPAILDSIQKVSDAAAQVDLAAIGQKADGALTDLRGVIGTPEAKALPASIQTALTEFQTTAAEIKALAAELKASGAMTKVGTMVDETTTAVQSVRAAAENIPAMVSDMSEVANKAKQIDFAGIGNQVEGIVNDLRTMLGTEDAKQLPRNLSDTLAAAAGLLNELRDGNAAGSLNDALASARTAMDEVAGAARQLPAVLARIDSVATTATTVLNAYGERSNFNAEAIGAMRELRRATASFGSLARMIERNPRAFILGR
ncbi:MlaD family protein [Paracoccus pacificus]|uniref:MlaD family protein n=1 Tax=Paracoccus pacificus TaxID=1463598 RepID=A0ABW4R327_9RHOB